MSRLIAVTESVCVMQRMYLNVCHALPVYIEVLTGVSDSSSESSINDLFAIS